MPLWHQSQLWSKPAIIFIGVWSCGAMMMIYLAALCSVPTHLYEAALVDGANGWQRFWRITFPMISPATFYNLVVGIIATLQIFEQSYVLTDNGGPAQSTYFVAYYLWRSTFRFNKIGYGAAMSWILLVLILVLTLIQFRLANRWVYYEYEEA
jgi:multiple sugar transport system permease protein